MSARVCYLFADMKALFLLILGPVLLMFGLRSINEWGYFGGGIAIVGVGVGLWGLVANHLDHIGRR